MEGVWGPSICECQRRHATARSINLFFAGLQVFARNHAPTTDMAHMIGVPHSHQQEQPLWGTSTSRPPAGRPILRQGRHAHSSRIWLTPNTMRLPTRPDRASLRARSANTHSNPIIQTRVKRHFRYQQWRVIRNATHAYASTAPVMPNTARQRRRFGEVRTERLEVVAGHAPASPCSSSASWAAVIAARPSLWGWM